ncbi:MAG: transposase [Nanoarchaeota archaeon]|nr:transposase [Nanoarchaeota archaeon]
MSERKTLRELSKNELIDLFFEERKVREKLESRLNKIEHYLNSFDNPHTPSSKQHKNNTKKKDDEDENNSEDNKPKKPRFPGKPKGSKGGGIKLPKPDEEVEHKLDVSPVNRVPLGEPVGHRIQTVIDFPDKPIITTRHIIYQYLDPTTGKIIEPEVDLPKGIYGKNLQAIIIMLKNMCNSKIEIAKFIRDLGAPTFCHTTIQNISTMFILGLTPLRNNILKELKQEEFLHSDETGFRLDGINRYVWGLFSKTKAIFKAGVTRGAYNFKKLIGNIQIIVVVDGYKGYWYLDVIQRCWAHLLRDFKSYAENNEEIKVQYKRIKILYEDLKKLNIGPPASKKDIEKVKWIFNDIIVCLKPINCANKLITLLKNGGNDWFTALNYENMPLDNNLAERELRRVVLLRKTIGCIRTWKGKRWIEIVMSVLQTWKLQGLNIFQNLKKYAC